MILCILSRLSHSSILNSLFTVEAFKFEIPLSFQLIKFFISLSSVFIQISPYNTSDKELSKPPKNTQHKGIEKISIKLSPK